MKTSRKISTWKSVFFVELLEILCNRRNRPEIICEDTSKFPPLQEGEPAPSIEVDRPAVGNGTEAFEELSVCMHRPRPRPRPREEGGQY